MYTIKNFLVYYYMKLILLLIIIIIIWLFYINKCEYFNPEAYGYETHKDISASDRIIFNKSHNDTHIIDNNITPFSLKNGTLKIYYFFLFFSIKSFA